MTPPDDHRSRRQARRDRKRRESQPPQYPQPPFGQNWQASGMPPQQGQPPQGPPPQGQPPRQGGMPQRPQGPQGGQGAQGGPAQGQPPQGRRAQQDQPSRRERSPQRGEWQQQGGATPLGDGSSQQNRPAPNGSPDGGYQVRHAGSQSASTAYSRSAQTVVLPVAGVGPAARSAHESALSAPESAYSAPEAAGVIGSSMAAKVDEDPRSFLRVTVIFDDRRGDLILPSNVALAELVPSLVRRFTSVTPRSVTRGYVLIDVGGKSLSPGKTLRDHGVEDGAVLTLSSRVKERDKTYDDIVEAVADAAAEMNKPWTPEHTASTAVASTAVLVLASLLMLFRLRPDVGIAVPIITGTIAVLLLGLAWVVQRMKRSWHAVIIAILSSIAAGVTGFSAIIAPVGELPSVFGGLAMMLVAGVSIPLLKQWREMLMIPMVVGAVIATIGGLYIAFDIDVPTVGVTIAGLAGITILLVPQLALRMSGLDRDRDSVDTKETRKLYTRGHRMMIAFWVSMALILLIVALPAVQTGRYGIAVVVLATLLLAMGSRRSHARVDVLVQYIGALAIFVLTAAAVMTTFPDSWPFVIVALLLVIIAVAAFGMVIGRTWTWTRRAADIAEGAAIVLLIPATVLALEIW